jgi:hypothetical protein
MEKAICELDNTEIGNTHKVNQLHYEMKTHQEENLKLVDIISNLENIIVERNA